MNFVSYVEGLIEEKRNPRVTSLLLVGGYVLSRLVNNSKLQRLALQGMLLSIDRTAHRGTRERLLLRYAKSHKLSWSALRAYVQTPYAAAPESWFDAFPFNAEFKAAARGLMLRAEGKIDEAIAELSALKLEDYELKLLVVNALRGLYHQRQNHEMIACSVIEFLNSEPDRILIKHAVGAAGSAEAVQRNDLFAAAVSRLFDDVDKIVSQPTLFNKYWKDALEGSLSVFDIEGAVRIARRARAHGLPASKLLKHVLALREELAPIIHVIEEAHRDIMERCGKRTALSRVGEVIIVVPAAAVRSNKIDYPGFRSDIRSCLKGIVATLEEDGVRYIVKSRIRNHGNLNLDLPYFSYHTTADEAQGLHYKETDRQGLFSFDRRGYAGWSLFADTPVEILDLGIVTQTDADDFFACDQASLIESRQSKYRQKNCLESLPVNFLFVPLQVIGDAVQSLAFATPFKMLDEVLAVAKSNNLEVVIKRHPACKSPEISKYLADHSNDLIVSEGNIHDIIPAAEAVCVVNSGVGAEALMYEKPVYVFGRSDYMNACHICERPGDFSRIYAPRLTRLSPTEFRKFWYIYRNIYACSLRHDENASNWIRSRVRQHLRDTQRAGSENMDSGDKWNFCLTSA
jgi:hypothetical protein